MWADTQKAKDADFKRGCQISMQANGDTGRQKSKHNYKHFYCASANVPAPTRVRKGFEI